MIVLLLHSPLPLTGLLSKSSDDPVQLTAKLLSGAMASCVQPLPAPLTSEGIISAQLRGAGMLVS